MFSKQHSSAEATTVNYWLGLNKIAEERWGAEGGKDDPLVRAGTEASAEPESDGWAIMTSGGGNRDMAYATDAARGKVLHLTTDSTNPPSGTPQIDGNFEFNLTGATRTSRVCRPGSQPATRAGFIIR